MKIGTLTRFEPTGATRSSMLPALATAIAAVSTVVAVVLCIWAILPLGPGLVLFAITVWFSIPGLVLAWLMYAPAPGRRFAAAAVGPVWGYGLSSVVLLGLWTAGLRGAVLLTAPLVAGVVAAVGGVLLRATLAPPTFRRADVIAVLLLLMMVPAVVGRPFAHVAEPLPEGRAYRAYFTADMIWRMAVVAEVSKGAVPPRNPFLRGEALHYYWLPHLLPAAEYRNLQRAVSMEQLLLVNSIVLGLAFVLFLYGFIRQWVSSPVAAAVGSMGAVVFTSFEGIERLWFLWRVGAPFAAVRDVNIDAVTRWFYSSLPIDGLQRLLWYQPHHSTAYALGFSALLVLAQARMRKPQDVPDAHNQPSARTSKDVLDRYNQPSARTSKEVPDPHNQPSARTSKDVPDPHNLTPRLLAFCGCLLGVCLLFSTFAAIMLTIMVALTAGVVLLGTRQWATLAAGALAGAVPLVVAVAAARTLRYVDESGASLVRVLLNPMAVSNVGLALLLSFGPMLILGSTGAFLAVRRRARQFVGIAAIIVVSFLFYFFVDVRDHQYVYVGWRSGHFLFVAFAVLVAYALGELWQTRRAIRRAVVVVTALLAVLSFPTFAIDFYNTQDITNRNPADPYSWTLVLSHDELAAHEWIRRATPIDAIVQVEPHVREGRRWADVPAFAERRMSAGLPISMVPLAKYEAASAKVLALYQEEDPEAAFNRAARLGIDYLIVGPPERRKFPQFETTLRARPTRFREAFRSGDVSIYMLEGGS
jgi:hypothetical protein